MRRAGEAAALAGTACLVLLLVGLRLSAAPLPPATFDEVSFLSALSRYDLLAFEPHFPGYALAVALARLAGACGSAVPYAAAAACVGGLAALRAQRVIGGWTGALAASLTLLCPLVAAESARPMADGVATALVTWGLVEAWAVVRAPSYAGRVFAPALLIGAAVAAKPDFLFFMSAPLALIPACRQPGRASLATLAGLSGPAALAVWALVEGCGGLSPAAGEATRFLAGHLGEWGGAVTATHAVQGPRLVAALAPACGLAGAEGPLTRLGSGLLLAALALKAPRRLRRATIVATLPYALWTLFGQNLEHPRHLLPLLPPLAALVATGLRALAKPLGARWAVALGAALLVGAASGTCRDAARSAAWGRPADRLEAWLSLRAASARLYTDGMGRALQWRHPSWDVRRVRDLAGARADLASDPSPPARIYFTGAVPGATTLMHVANLGSLTVYRLADAGPPQPVKTTRPPP